MMITEFDRQSSMSRILDDAELDAVNGGAGNLANACIRATLQWIMDKGRWKFGDDLRIELTHCGGE